RSDDCWHLGGTSHLAWTLRMTRQRNRMSGERLHSTGGDGWTFHGKRVTAAQLHPMDRGLRTSATSSTLDDRRPADRSRF
ncbi:MAG: hypothetical protein EA424_15185, partial [Planctomycetaceae bacterium]